LSLSKWPRCRTSAWLTRHWPCHAAAFGDHEAFPTLIEKAAILVERLARNHPLPDGNKRCAFLAVERFLAANGQPISDPVPDVDVPMMGHVAAGEATQGEVIAWLEERTTTAE
jgi:death on curing protein